jgi:hypothetical protein
MEFTKSEASAVQQVETDVLTKELETLELMLVGGGMGDVVFA